MAIRKIVSRSIGVDVIAAEDLANNSVTAAEIQDGVIGLDKLSATGTKDATTFLRGDNSFQVVTTPTLSSLGIDNHDDINVDASGHAAIGTTTQNGASLVIDNGGVQSPAASGNMNTGFQIQAGTGSQALNIGNDGDGTWYNSAYANNSGVPRNHRFLVGENIEGLKIDTSGYVFQPKMPHNICQGSSVSNPTISSNSSISSYFNLTLTNGTSMYNTGNGRFVAPIDGVYLFGFSLMLAPPQNESNRVAVRLNGSDWKPLSGAQDVIQPAAQVSGTGNSQLNLSDTVLIPASAGDYWEIYARAGSNVGPLYIGHSWMWSCLLYGTN